MDIRKNVRLGQCDNKYYKIREELCGRSPLLRCETLIIISMLLIFPDKNLTEFPKENFFGEQIGRGFNGYIFNLIPYKDKVAKVGTYYESRFYDSNYKFHHKVSAKKKFIEFQKYSKLTLDEDHLVNVYESGILHKNDKSVIFYYVMDRLNILSDDEDKVFHSIIEPYRNNNITYNDEQELDILQSLSKHLEFDLEKIHKFFQRVRQSKIKHPDIHKQNIMKDSNNNFKLIDLDDLYMESKNE